MKKGAEEKVFTNWTVKELLGKGAFGKVYRIEREEFGTVYQAAMKKIVIPQSQEDVEDAINEGMDEQSVTSYFRSFVEEIVNEFKLMAQLKGHTNIVSYEDHMVIPHEDGIGWDILIRMELLKSLKSVTSERNMTEAEVVRLGIDMCNALELCGKMNIIHRDIKPENMFVTSLGEYKLGDFGIARTAEKTMSNLSKKGTYTYMAPEVYKGEAYNATVDIYSLGIVMYRFMNYNRAPFLPPYPQPISFSDREASMTRRISEEPMPAPACGSKELKRIILKACAYRPSGRYQSPAEMRSELEKVLRDMDGKDVPAGQAQEAAQGAVSQRSADGFATGDLQEEMTVTTAGQTVVQRREEALWDEEDATVTESAIAGEAVARGAASAEFAAAKGTAPVNTATADDAVSANGVMAEEAASAGIGAGAETVKQEEPPVSAKEAYTQEDEEATVSIFGDRTEAAPQKKTAPPVPAPAPQPEPEKPKKSKKGLFIGIGAVAAVVLILAGIALAVGGGGSAAPPSGEFDGFSYMETSEEGEYDDLLTGIDVEDAEDARGVKEEIVPASERYLYGHYFISGLSLIDWDSEKPFFEGMETVAIGEKNMAVIPAELYCFPEGTLYNTPMLEELLDETGSDRDMSYASRTYLRDFLDDDEEIFEAIACELFGDEIAPQVHNFYVDNIKGQRDTAELVFVDELKNRESLIGYYRMDGSKMDFCYLDLDEAGQMVLSPMPFEVAFSGKNLDISKDGITRTMEPYRVVSSSSNKIQIFGYANSETDAYEGISYIFVSAPASEVSTMASVYFTDGWRSDGTTVEMGEDNTLTLTWEQEAKLGAPGEKRTGGRTITASYLDCDGLGFILHVDGKDYFYQKTETEYYAALVGDSVIDSELDEETLQLMGMTQMEMLKAMQDAFAAEGYTIGEDVNIDEKTGRITLNDGILFDVGSTELSEEGKEYLSRIFAVLDKVIFEGGYEECLDEIIVEGHTDSTGDYEENQELSEARAYAVDDYCSEVYPHISSSIDAVGRSSDELIYDENGNEDRDASRRVVFRITLDADVFADYMEEGTEGDEMGGMEAGSEDPDAGETEE